MVQSEPEPLHPRRRWRIPPAPLQGNGEMEGLSILREFPGDTGGVLWQALRAVTLWASIPPPRRAGLFNPGVADLRGEEVSRLSVPELREPLEGILGLLREPESTDGRVIAGACAVIARWAAGAGASMTELEFLSAAALAFPDDPVLAITAARAFRDRGLYVHAEGWYQRTVALSRRAANWDTYARAYVGLAKTWLLQGRQPNARRAFEKALRTARRHGLRDAQGMALHDLFTLDADEGDRGSALRRAAEATRVYGPGHRLLPVLAHDVARFWLQQGSFGLALPVLHAVIPRIRPPAQTIARGNLGLAAAQEEEEETFQRAWREVMEADDEEPGKAEALVLLAQGASALGLWECAEETARRAREIAEAREERRVLRDLEALPHPVQMGPGETGAHRAKRRVEEEWSEEGVAIRLNQELLTYLAAPCPA